MTLEEAEDIIEDELLNRGNVRYYTQDRKLKLIKARRILADYIAEEMERINEQDKEDSSRTSKDSQ